jgi:Uncharacterized protein conserved in bacteria (DUF2252)
LRPGLGEVTVRREVGRMAVRIAHPMTDDRRAKGLEARDRTALPGHTKWRPAADRPDPVALLKQNTTRELDLVPVRQDRMMVSPFTFYRSAAKIMAADLKDTPVAGLDAQLCGDAHLSNFGVFPSPERRLNPGVLGYGVIAAAGEWFVCLAPAHVRPGWMRLGAQSSACWFAQVRRFCGRCPWLSVRWAAWMPVARTYCGQGRRREC